MSVSQLAQLVVQELSLTFQGKDLIQKISLNFEPGQVHGVLGPNGSGKSTFLKCMAGIWIPTHGQVLWEGKDLLKQKREEISRAMSLVPQNHQTPFDFSAKEMVAMGRYPYRFEASSQEKVEALIQGALERVDAWHLKDRGINQLSNGERQRVMIARSLVTETPILLLDEPTASLDPYHQISIWRMLKELAQQGKIVIVAVHDLASAERYCDYISLLHQGRCVATDRAHQALQPHLIKQVFNINFAKRIEI
jgi:iron complex transport system ATP-binding protein